ncbi:MAG: phytanoyl-CoA dioxygenase family protein [Candidatus Neomarinimicrobiota bacterium]
MYLNDSINKSYDKKGYSIIRDVIEPKLVKEVQSHVRWLQNKYPKIRPEAFHHDLLVNDPFVHNLLDNKNMLDIVEMIIGPDIALFGAHYIAKKPNDGKPVGWHQDGSYWPLEPMNVVSIWLAGTDSNKSNGCMRVLPGTQNSKLMKPSQMIKLDNKDYVLDLAISNDDLDSSNAVDVELSSGDISIHNPSIIHGSNANLSDHWRIGLTLRFIPTSTFVNRENWECILLRGSPKNGVKNNYIQRPTFKDGEHMYFSGYEHFL